MHESMEISGKHAFKTKKRIKRKNLQLNAKRVFTVYQTWTQSGTAQIIVKSLSNTSTKQKRLPQLSK